MDKKRLAYTALDECRARGAEYADVRLETIEDENLSISSGTVEPIESTVSTGIGIRVLKNGAWGFASTDRLEEKAVRGRAWLALRMAEASAIVNKAAISLAPVEPVTAEYTSSYEIDPFTIALDEKIAFLREIDDAIRSAGGPAITSRNI
ncbi:MAG: hypothetical protein JSV44_12405, partial [Candidatus Zixiibacteriota bacterium]